MANYTEEEQSTLIRLYREYCQTKQGTFKLKSEDKLILMKHLENKHKEFNSYDEQGFVYYRKFALPHRLPQQRTVVSRRDFEGEGLTREETDLLESIEDRIQAECLVDIWEGDIPDECILFASLIEAGFGAKVLPNVINNGMMGPTKVSENAQVLQKKRKEAKLKAMKEQIDKDNQ